jgi:hypothetical protein
MGIIPSIGFKGAGVLGAVELMQKVLARREAGSIEQGTPQSMESICASLVSRSWTARGRRGEQRAAQTPSPGDGDEQCAGCARRRPAMGRRPVNRKWAAVQ